MAFSQAAGSVYLLCNPHNPSGTVPTREELTELVKLANQYDIFIISDEIHFPLIRPGKTFTSILAIPEFHNGVVCVSSSKGFNLAGFKSALMVPPAADDFSVQIVQTARKLFLGDSSSIGAFALTVAFNEGDAWLDQLNQELAENETILANLLTSHFPAAKFFLGEATYLQWVDFSAYADPAFTSITQQFLSKAKVAFSDGTPFGGPNAQNFARINFATHPDILSAAIHRITQDF
jgi:cystathionine beta-lyase